MLNCSSNLFPPQEELAAGLQEEEELEKQEQELQERLAHFKNQAGEETRSRSRSKEGD